MSPVIPPELKLSRQLYYLASPYSHPDPYIRQQRFSAAVSAQASLLLAGYTCISPIVQCHELALRTSLPFTADFWASYNKNLLFKCQGLLILTIPGWKESKGVAAETGWAIERGLQTLYVSLMGDKVKLSQNEDIS